MVLNIGYHIFTDVPYVLQSHEYRILRCFVPYLDTEAVMNLTRAERFKDARVVHNQHGKQTMDEVAIKTGISKSMIQVLEDDSIKR